MATPQNDYPGSGGPIALAAITALVGALIWALSESRKESKPVFLPKLPSVELPQLNLPTVGPSLPGAPAAYATRPGEGAIRRSRIEFENRSGEPALVRLVGPSCGEVHVPDSSTGAIEKLAPGRYRIVIRYGSEGRYRYAEGDPFEIEETATTYSSVHITLHPVVGGNYRTRPATAADFEAAAPTDSRQQ